jgi:tRNA A37 threonylcarbamoyltransferase TsaD
MAGVNLGLLISRRKNLFYSRLNRSDEGRTDLEAIFGEVCPRITQLVQAQVDTLKKSSLNAKAIFLVGGFGANKYLKEELQKSFKGIEIQQPKDAYVDLRKSSRINFNK